VIYALNTKNDEHEAIVATLREQQEEQIQKILAETSAKVASFKKQIQNNSDQTMQIQALQDKLNEHELLRVKALREFEDYKQQSEQKAFDLKTQYSQKMIQLAHDALQSKQALEKRMEDMENIRDQFEMEKQTALRLAEERHNAEVDRLMNSKEGDQRKLVELREKLEAEHSAEMDKMRVLHEKINAEKAQVIEDYEAKLNKAQAFYEKELEALQNSHNASHEEQLEVLKEQYQKVKKDLEFSESQSKKRIDDLLNQISSFEEDSEKYKNEIMSLKSRLDNQSSEIGLLGKQVCFHLHEWFCSEVKHFMHIDCSSQKQKLRVHQP
jgi:hypothetical protein